MKTLLFLNGLFPKNIPDISLYDFIVCTDGAYNSLKKKGITPDVISGDLDSII
ncbi:MAG: thiamine diphosphokinase, partial [Flavobacteriales bacterium]